jgi:hypothetical protein
MFSKILRYKRYVFVAGIAVVFTIGITTLLNIHQEKVLGVAIRKPTLTALPTSTDSPSPIPTDTPTPMRVQTPSRMIISTPTPTNTPAPVQPQQTNIYYVQPTNIPALTTQSYINPTSTPVPPTPTPFYSQTIEDALSQLNQTLTNIENQPIAMNVINGKRDKAYQDWVSNNQQIYSDIVNTHYKGNLNAILVAHGLNYYVIQ